MPRLSYSTRVARRMRRRPMECFEDVKCTDRKYIIIYTASLNGTCRLRLPASWQFDQYPVVLSVFGRRRVYQGPCASRNGDLVVDIKPVREVG